jgi:hypothetical protein
MKVSSLVFVCQPHVCAARPFQSWDAVSDVTFLGIESNDLCVYRALGLLPEFAPNQFCDHQHSLVQVWWGISVAKKSNHWDFESREWSMTRKGIKKRSRRGARKARASPSRGVIHPMKRIFIANNLVATKSERIEILVYKVPSNCPPFAVHRANPRFEFCLRVVPACWLSACNLAQPTTNRDNSGATQTRTDQSTS